MGKLTDIQIRNWTKAGNPIAKAGGDGLTFTLSSKGTASWILSYRTAGAKSQREITLGRYSADIPLVEARKIATTTRARVQQGIDVARQKQVARKVAEKSWTIKKLADDYLEKSVGRLAPSTIKNRGQQLRSYVHPIIGHLSASEVSATDIVEHVARKSLHVARLVLIVLREILPTE